MVAVSDCPPSENQGIEKPNGATSQDMIAVFRERTTLASNNAVAAGLISHEYRSEIRSERRNDANGNNTAGNAYQRTFD